MLKSLKIRDYALIASLDLDLKSGMTAMTGETGSGKSIVLGALGLLLGSRSDSTSVRNGAARCTVEGSFQRNERIDQWLQKSDLDAWDEVVIRREISAQGRSRAFINDTPVKAHSLQSLGNLLVDLHGQDGTALLLQREYQLAWIDAHAGNDRELQQYREAFAALQESQAALSKLELIRSQPQTDLDYIQYQLKELDALDLARRDWPSLLEEKEVLENSSDIRESLLAAWQAVTADAQDDAPMDRLFSSLKSMQRAASMSDRYRLLQERLHSVIIELTDLMNGIESEAESVESDPKRLAQLTEWHNELQRVMHKHNAPDAAALAQLSESLTQQLDAAAHLDETYAKAQHEVSLRHREAMECGKALQIKRQEASSILSQSIEKSLARLSIPRATVVFDWQAAAQPDEWGIEEVAILFSANAGQTPLPLHKVASGGEKSRLMLAFKAVGKGSQSVPSIVLDEIDTGVSGRVAEEMAKLMKQMAENQQVIAVTHLPQVAAAADHHLRVSKSSTEQTTVTAVTELQQEERIQELAGMLSGSSISAAAIENASALLGLRSNG